MEVSQIGLGTNNTNKSPLKIKIPIFKHEEVRKKLNKGMQAKWLREIQKIKV
jgi:hypothetical protein